MPKVLLHHVSYPVRDVEESASFYENLFNLERLDRPPFSIPGVWLACHDRQIHLVLNDAGTYRTNPALADLRCKDRTEPMPPIPHRFMADIDAAFMQQIFYVSKRQRKTNVQHHRQANDLAARFKVAKWVRFGHPTKLRNRPARLKPVSFDSARARRTASSPDPRQD